MGHSSLCELYCIQGIEQVYVKSGRYQKSAFCGHVNVLGCGLSNPFLRLASMDAANEI